MGNLAPIGVSTYSRINHLKQTIESLQRNILAKNSDLYIFSDAPKKGDKNIVVEVRKYIKTIDGFKNVYIIEREKNKRVANNREGIKQLLDDYGKVIWLEDDIVTAPGFLTFMNDALDFYQNDERILSVTGYSPPIDIPHNYTKDVFLLKRFSGWGLASWKKKFDPFGFDLKIHGIEDFLGDNNKIDEFKQNGEDMFETLMKQYNGEFEGLDVQIMFYQFQYNMFTIYPRKSLVQNIGHDGSGIHSGITDKFYVEKLWEKIENFKFEKAIQVDKRIKEANCKFRSIPFSYALRYFITEVDTCKVIIFGAGSGGLKILRLFKDINKDSKKEIQVINFMDNEKDKWGQTLRGIKIVKPELSLLHSVDKIIIASEWHIEIKNQLLKMGIDKEKIVSTF